MPIFTTEPFLDLPLSRGTLTVKSRHAWIVTRARRIN